MIDRIYKSISLFRNRNFPKATKRDIIAWLVLLIGSVLVGSLLVYFTFREGIDLGDGSTFYQFAHNLVNGEVIYRDFIHFRTPGSYFLQSFFLSVFGDQPSSLRFALGFEARVLYTFFFVVAIGLFLRFKHILIGSIATGTILFLPAYAQLRTILAFLAVIFYIQSYRTLGKTGGWLLGSGVLTGFAFIFGQEAALMALVTIGGVELTQLIKRKQTVAITLRRVGIVGLGLLIGILPLIVYILIKSDIGTFLYYTLYYAFILQPQGMDVAYPAFDHSNTLFYLPFLLILSSFYILYSNRKLPGIVSAVLIGFVCVRLITLLGRTDLGHLFFILPELLFLSVLSLYYTRTSIFTYVNLLKFTPYAVALIFIFYIAINNSSMVIVASVPLIALAFLNRPSLPPGSKIRNNPTISFVTTSVMAGLLSVTLFLLIPSYINVVNSMSKRGVTTTQIGGVNVGDEVFSHVNRVKDAVQVINPQTIFSYPIQPYYYSLAPKHAARYLTFEPQTTEKEQDITIEDLKRSQPEVVIFDPMQAASMSQSLWKINDYLMSEYEIHKSIAGRQILWVMTKKQSSTTKLSYLALTLYKNKRNHTSKTAHDIQSPDKGIHNGVGQASHSEAVFDINPNYQLPTQLVASVYYNDSQSLAHCGIVRILHKDKEEETHRICSVDGVVSIDLRSSVQRITLVNDSDSQLVWNDPILSR